MKNKDRQMTFFFDYLSHNAYLAWTQLPKLQAKYGVSIRLVPVLFAGLLKAHGQYGPAEQPAKLLWMTRNVLRKAAHLGVPIAPPAFHPFNPLLALRATSLEMTAEQRWLLTDGLMKAVWVESLHISEAPVVAKIASAAGLDGESLVREAQTREASGLLRSQTERAIDAGVFGVPSMVVKDEVFFGYDDFPNLELVLGNQDPLHADELSQWVDGNIRASAMRKEVKDNPKLRQQ